MAEINNRIEEVKKIPLEVYHRMELFWHEPETADIVVDLVDGEGEASPLTERLISVLYELGYRLSQPLDDKELERTLTEIVASTLSDNDIKPRVAEILALLQRKTEEVKEYYEHKCKHCQYMYSPNVVEEAKRELLKEIEGLFVKKKESLWREADGLKTTEYYVMYKQAWQALKGGE